nr:hypothetical protein [Streptomyces sp. C8S0]
MPGQQLGEDRAEPLVLVQVEHRRHVLRPAGTGHVPHERGTRRPVVDLDRSLDDAGAPAQRGLDLADLNPLAADLDLGVGAAQELQIAVGVDAAEITGAVQPSTGRGGVRVRDEHLGGPPR